MRKTVRLCSQGERGHDSHDSHEHTQPLSEQEDDDMEENENDLSQSKETNETNITPPAYIYQRGLRQVFATSKRQGTLPATSNPRLESTYVHLEAKLKKENENLELQRRMAKHYARKHKLVSTKLRKALFEIQTLKRENELNSLGFLAEASY